MANDEPDLEREGKLGDRRARQQAGGRSSPLRKVGAAAVVGVTLVASPLIIFGPAAVSKFFGFGAPEEQQATSEVDLGVSGVSTQIPASKAETKPDPTPAEKKPEAKPANPDADRLAKLEALMKKLADKPQAEGVSAEQIKALMDKQEEALRKAAETDKAAKEAEAKRLEEERAAEAKREEETRALAEQKRQRREELAKIAEEFRKKQIESEALVFDGSDADAPLGADGKKTGPDGKKKGDKNDPAGGAGGADAAPDKRSSDQKFLDESAGGGFETSHAKQLADTSRIIVQGTIISAVLETAINTELPGNIRAQVTEPVFSYDGEKILMPSGTRLIGSFSNDINTAQKRVLIAWNRAITPDGQSVEIGSTGTDQLGRSGTRGNVDGRFFQRYGAAVLITTISAIPDVISSLASGKDKQGSGSSGNSGGGAADSATKVGSDAAKALSDQTKTALEDRLSLPPIIRIPQGEDIRVFVNKDLVF
jgi:type IV secretion system protein VirB10